MVNKKDKDGCHKNKDKDVGHKNKDKDKDKESGQKLSQWAKIKIVCKVVRGKLQKAHTMGYLTVPGMQVRIVYLIIARCK